MKRWIIIAVVILGLAGGGFILKNRADQTKPETGSADHEHNHGTVSVDVSSAIETGNVSYGDEGFSPAVIKVNLHTTVTFTNNSSNPLWVASGPHPTHTAYPEFDSKKAIGHGDSYSFTFEKAGTWGYHNHLSEENSATVVVEN